MAVSIRAGEIGSVEPYAINGFEDMQPGPINGDVELKGEVETGDCTLDTAHFGRRT